MINIFKSRSFSIGFAMFSMFFGAGNVIFPLSLGRYAGDKTFYAILGLILTAVIMPVVGSIAMILFNGNYRDFFGRLGRVPGLLTSLMIICLLGPFGSTPRCIALAYSTLTTSFLSLSPVYFSAMSCGIIFLFTWKKSHIISLLGWVLTPLLLLSLGSIIVIGLISPSEIQTIRETSGTVFLHGLKEGYNTMDLLAAFFFSSTILSLLRMRANSEGTIQTAIQASIIGATLLALIYIGFSYLAALHGQDLGISEKSQLLAKITMKIAGPKAGILVCITVALACLTTAIALVLVFTDFMQKEIFRGKVSYEATLIGSLLLTFFVSTFQFTRISVILGPVLQICYPGLIVLTLLNIAYRLKGFKPVKIPVTVMFGFSLYLFFR